MRFALKMPKALYHYYDQELLTYRNAMKRAEYSQAWYHLERAHILGQRYALNHSYVHWRMLCFGIIMKNSKEIIGQLPRLIFGGVKSFVGKVPVGNPGGANVPPLRPFALDDEIRQIFIKAGIVL